MFDEELIDGDEPFTNLTSSRLPNVIEFPDIVTKIIPWRSYLIIFTTKTNYLAKYDSTSDTYNIKILSEPVKISFISIELFG